MKFFLTLLVVFFITICYTQRNFILEEYDAGRNRVITAENLTYYGMDFSLFKINETRKIGTEDKIIDYIPAWISEFEQEWIKDPYNSKMQKSMKKKISEHKVEVQNSYKLLKEKEWVTFSNNNLKLDSLEAKINNYHKHSDSGIGFVIIMELFDKPNEKVIANYTFFDVSTGKILWNMKVSGFAGKAGMTRHWAQGINSTFLHFITYYSKVRRRKS